MKSDLKKRFEVGGILLQIEGDGHLFELIHEEFKFCEVRSINKTIDLNVKILSPNHEINFTPKYYSLAGSISFDDKNLMKKENNYSYLVKNLFDFNSSTELIISYKNKSGLLSLLKNIIKMFARPRGFNTSNTQIKESVLSYSIFWYIFHVVLLKKGSSFIHSSVVDVNGKGIVFVGTGGCGKTSTTFKFLEESNTKYLSEDFGIIDRDGFAYFNPKKMSIYHTDVKFGQRDLVAYVKYQMPKFDKLLWSITKMLGVNPVRKISPVTILGESKVKAQTEIKTIYFLARSNSEKVLIKDISTEDLVERALNASFRELKSLYEVLTNAHAVANQDNLFLRFSEIENKTREVYKCAFNNVEKKLLVVPLKSAPEKVLHEIEINSLVD